jgi:hypothetical protein
MGNSFSHVFRLGLGQWVPILLHGSKAAGRGAEVKRKYVTLLSLWTFMVWYRIKFTFTLLVLAREIEYFVIDPYMASFVAFYHYSKWRAKGRCLGGLNFPSPEIPKF